VGSQQDVPGSQQTVNWVVAQSAAATTGGEGLRERKKALMRQRLTDTATEMFLAKGFDAVRVTEIAAACGVSEKTVYNYFPTKESLVLDRWESTARSLRTVLSDSGVHPVDAVQGILAGELTALASWLDAQPDTASAITSVRRFGELVAATPALRAYHYETMSTLTAMTADLLAGRAGLTADAPEPQIAATALLGLWGVHFTALRKYLDDASTPTAVCRAVTADIAAAARLIRTGLGSFARPWGASSALCGAAEDGAGWARLVLAIEESYGTQDIVSADDLLDDLRDPNVDPERGTIAAFSEGNMIAYAGLRASPSVTGRHEMHLHGGVHPSQRGRGLGTRLLAWAEQAALPLHQARYPGHPLATDQ
jgi:AcrR family transcriptional regulator